MEERIHIFFCILAGLAGFGLIGAVFGALARVFVRAHGRTAGGFVGAAVVRLVEDTSRQALRETTRSILSGGSDGACFLGLLGGLLGAYAGYQGFGLSNLVLPALLIVALLALWAAMFGAAGYLLVHTGVRVVGFLFLGGMAGALLGAWLDGNDGLLLGTLGGGLLGTCTALVGRREPPE